MAEIARVVPVRTGGIGSHWVAEANPRSTCPHPSGPRRCVTDGGASWCRYLADATRGGAAIRCRAPWSAAELASRALAQAAAAARFERINQLRYRAMKAREETR